jgi:hypothetical protein
MVVKDASDFSGLLIFLAILVSKVLNLNEGQLLSKISNTYFEGFILQASME